MRPCREFLSAFSRGALTAGVGFQAAGDLDFAPASAEHEFGTLNFGPIEPRVRLLKEPEALAKGLDAAVRDNLQARACAAVLCAGELGHEARPNFDVLLRTAISEDGALHSEKFCRTCSVKFSEIRPAFR